MTGYLLLRKAAFDNASAVQKAIFRRIFRDVTSLSLSPSVWTNGTLTIYAWTVVDADEDSLAVLGAFAANAAAFEDAALEAQMIQRALPEGGDHGRELRAVVYGWAWGKGFITWPADVPHQDGNFRGQEIVAAQGAALNLVQFRNESPADLGFEPVETP